MEKKKKGLMGLIITCAVVACLSFGVAFAALATTLTINGSANVAPASWNVFFDELNVSSSNTVGGSSDNIVVTSPTLTATSIGTYELQLEKPGDQATINFMVKNEGSIPAKLATFTKPDPVITDSGTSNATPAGTDATLVKNNLVYTIKWEEHTNGDIVDVTADNMTLQPGLSAYVTITVGYAGTATQVPKDKVNIAIPTVTFVFEQA